MAYSISDEIVVNYTNADKDECIHFLTHIDAENGPAPDASYYVSPSARTIFTSHYNEWFLRTHYDLDNIRSWNLNTKVTLEFRKKKYIFTFLDAKHCLGSISILLYGNCGAHLYTGNFAYCSNFLKSPLLAPLLERKVPLKCLYMDATHYEQDSNFLGIDENIELATALMRYTNARILLFIDSNHLYPILAELAIRLQEKLYISSSESDRFLQFNGYNKYFTRKEQGSRITVFEELVKKDYSNGLVVYFHRVVHKENCEFHKYKVDPRTSAHHFYFYSNSNHQDCCRLLNKLIPEELIHLNRAVIDRSKMSFHKFNINKSATFKKSISASNNKKTVVVSKHYLQSMSKVGIDNLCDLTKSESTSEQSKQGLHGMGKSSKGIQNNEKPLLYKSILRNPFDTSHIHKPINSDEEISGKIIKKSVNKQNSNPPNLTTNSTHDVSKKIEVSHALQHSEQFEGNNPCDLIRVESDEQPEIIICSDDDTETEPQCEATSFQGTIRVKKFDESYFHKAMSSDNSSGTNTTPMAEKINTISPCLTNSSSNNISPILKLENVLTHQKTILAQLQETFIGSNAYGSVTSKSHDQPEIINCTDDTETKVQGKPPSCKGLIRVRKFDESYFHKAGSSNNSSGTMSTNIIGPETNISTNTAPKLKVKKLLTHQEILASQVKGNKACGSVTPKSHDQLQIINCSDDTETKVRGKATSCKGSVRVRKFDESYFHKVVSSNNSSGTMSTAIIGQENTMSPCLTKHSTINISQKLIVKHVFTHQETIASQVKETFKGNNACGSVTPKSQDQPEIINCSDDFETKVQGKATSCKGSVLVRKFDESHFHKVVNSNNSSGTMATTIKGQENTISPCLPINQMFKPIKVKKILAQQENMALHNQETFQGNNTYGSIIIKSNKQHEIDNCSKSNKRQSKPLLLKRVITLTKVGKIPTKLGKIPLHKLRNSKRVCEPIATKSLDEEISSLTNSGANVSKKFEVKNILIQQENSLSQNQETVDGNNACNLIRTEENTQNEVDNCSETNKKEIQDQPSFYKGVVHRNKLDLLINCKHVFSEIKGSIQDEENGALPSSTANSSYNTCLESGTNFLIVPKQLLHSSQNLTKTFNPTIDNINKNEDNDRFNSSDNICTTDKTTQNDAGAPSIISSSPCKIREKVKNSLKVIVQNESVIDDFMKKSAQPNDKAKNICVSEHLAKEDNLKDESLPLDNIDNRNERDSSVWDEGCSKAKRIKLDDVNLKKLTGFVPRETRSKRSLNDEPKDSENCEMIIRKSIVPCSVVIDTNSITKRYFYSPSCKGYLPSFFGFHRTAIRPRKMVNALRILKQKYKLDVTFDKAL